MRKMSKMMYVNEGHEISIIPSPNDKNKDYIITEYYNGQEVSYRKETNASAMRLAKKYKDLGYDSF